MNTAFMCDTASSHHWSLQGWGLAVAVVAGSVGGGGGNEDVSLVLQPVYLPGGPPCKDVSSRLIHI